MLKTTQEYVDKTGFHGFVDLGMDARKLKPHGLFADTV